MGNNMCCNVPSNLDWKIAIPKRRPSSHISRLPNDLLTYILCKLPITTLTECRHVCKLWREIISDPNFVNVREPTSCLVLCVGRKNSWLELQDSESSSPKFMISKLLPPPGNRKLPKRKIQFANSCNGLICAYEELMMGDSCNDFFIYILNPLLNWEYIGLPPLDNLERKTDWSSCKLGFCIKTSRFKVIRFSVLQAKTKVFIYTLGSDLTWRNLEDATKQIKDMFEIIDGVKNITSSFQWDLSEAYVNGSFHWLFYNLPQAQNFLGSFNFESETFVSIPLPPNPFGDSCIVHYIGVLRDCLCCCFNHGINLRVYEIWLMKEYGVKESWTKLLVTENYTAQIGNEVFSFRPIKLFENGDVLVWWGSFLFIYNVAAKRFEKLKGEKIQTLIRAVVHKPRFASLADIYKTAPSKI